MNEVEKMYKNAGVKKINTQYANNISYHLVCYPPFTAEKQIELIKILGSLKDYIVEIDKFKGVYYVGCREAGSNNKHWGSHDLFEEALAELINNLWQDLIEEEQEQIKNILESEVRE